jgi:predicted DNA-binding transcriptional regulator AlpA
MENVKLTTKPQLLSPCDVARKRGCTLDWIYRELRVGKFPGARKVGKRWLIPADAATKKGQTHAGEQG